MFFWMRSRCRRNRPRCGCRRRTNVCGKRRICRGRMSAVGISVLPYILLILVSSSVGRMIFFGEVDVARNDIRTVLYDLDLLFAHFCPPALSSRSISVKSISAADIISSSVAMFDSRVSVPFLPAFTERLKPVTGGGVPERTSDRQRRQSCMSPRNRADRRRLRWLCRKVTIPCHLEPSIHTARKGTPTVFL